MSSNMHCEKCFVIVADFIRREAGEHSCALCVSVGTGSVVELSLIRF
jgi:hypothetical protein